MKTDITIILDRSGSMQKIASDTIGGVNKFITDQKSAPGEATFTLVQFSDHHTVIHDAVPIHRAELLTDKTFIPSGWTALLDAVGYTIDATGRRLRDSENRPDKVICVIVTDGEENASKVFTRSQVFDKITHQRDKYSWEFVFIGANQDAFKEAYKLGIQKDWALNYTANTIGTANTYTVLSDNVARLRGGASANLAWSDEDRKKATGDTN